MNRSTILHVIAALGITLAAGCKGSPQADPEFNDAAKFVLRSYDDPAIDIAYALRQYERQVYLAMDVEDNNVINRALELARLEQSDIEGLGVTHGRDPALALPVALGGSSLYTPTEHASIQFMADQTPVEPYSPDHYDRVVVEGDDCFGDQSCEWLRTENDLTKKNAILEIPYFFYKDFRWVDMNLPARSEFLEGEEVPSETDDPRWAMLALSWTTESYEGENGKTAIDQTYTIDVWIPRDGRGFVRDGSEENVDGGDWESDSSNGNGTLRMLALWSETRLGVAAGEDLVVATTRSGIQDNFNAADEWLAEELGERE